MNLLYVNVVVLVVQLDWIGGQQFEIQIIGFRTGGLRGDSSSDPVSDVWREKRL